MKNIFILFALLSITIFSSCDHNEMENEHAFTYQTEIHKVGLADFTVEHDDLTLFEGDDLLITNKSENAVSYHWDFGNGDSSTEAQPNYEYEIHGYYTITLTITDSKGNIEESSEEILVLCLFGGGNHDF